MRVFVSRTTTGRWNALVPDAFGAAISLFPFGDSTVIGLFGAAIGLFTFNVGELSCCVDSLACPAAGI